MKTLMVFLGVILIMGILSIADMFSFYPKEAQAIPVPEISPVLILPFLAATNGAILFIRRFLNKK